MEAKREGRAHMRLRFDADRMTKLAAHLLHQIEPHPGGISFPASILPGEEGIEDARDIMRLDADPLILHPELNGAAGLLHRELERLGPSLSFIYLIAFVTSWVRMKASHFSSLSTIVSPGVTFG